MIPGEQPDLSALPPESSPVKRRLAAQYVRDARDRLTSTSGTRPAFDIELLANCLRTGAALTEIPVHWRDMAGSTFSVPRHSAAAFRDVAALWLRSRVSEELREVPLCEVPSTT